MAPLASRWSDRLLWGVVAVAAAAVVVVAIARGRVRERHGTEGAAPRLSLPRLDGKGTASIQPGRVTVVDFWATWCAPCRISMPRIQKVWREYAPRGVDLYSVDTDDPGAEREAQVKEFLLSNGLTFPVVLDDGSALTAFSVSVLPTMLVLDGDARVIWKHVGALTAPGEEELRGVLDRALAGPSAARGG
jgi:cytochrome c biogenesis protein CcmG, thiol:disulfide interchange protein DsbE